MPEDKKKLNLSDLIDINFLQKLQDAFAKTMDIASIAVDDTGIITKPSNFTNFCLKYAKYSELGVIKCAECDIKWGKIAAEKGEPIIYECQGGLTNFAVPIIVDGNHVGTILGAQVFVEEPNEDNFKKIAKELGVDENEYIEAMREIKIVPVEKIKTAANLLFIIANAISEVGHKNLELIERNNRASLYRNIMETVRSSLDINEIKQTIVDIVGRTLNADICFIVEYDNIKNKFLPITDEYLSSPNIISCKDVDVNIEAPFFSELLKNGKPILVNNKEIFENTDNINFSEEIKTMEKYQINSLFAFPLFHIGEFLGVLSIQYVNTGHYISEGEITIITMIANQIAISIYQARLYKITKQQAEREAILKQITEKIRSSLEINQTLTFICDEIGKLFNVQRAAISEMFPPYNSGNFIARREYKINDAIKGLKEVYYPKEVGAYIAETVLDQGINLSINDIQKSGVPESFKTTYDTMGVKSILCVPIKKENDKWGTICLAEYNYYREWTDDEISLLETIAGQVYIAIKQAELHSKTKQQAEREAILRQIIETMRSSIEIDKTLSFICDAIAKTFKVQRTSIEEFPVPGNYEEFTIRKEFKIYPDEKGIGNIKHLLKISKYYGENVVGKGEVLAINNIQESDTPDYFKESYALLGVKSILVIPIIKEDEKWGVLVLSEYNNYRTWSDEEIELAKSIANQIYIAIKQATYYEREKKRAERETLLRKTAEVVRSTLDIEEIKKYFVEITRSYFNADRCIFDDYNKETKQFLPFRIEKLKSPKIKSLIGFDVEKEFPEFAAKLKKGHNVIIKDLEKTLSRKKLTGYKAIDTLQKSDVKSDYGLAVNYKEQIMGILIIHFVNHKRALTTDEFNFLKVLRDQVGIALYQAELFSITKQQAERERILRDITNKIRSSLDLEEIKHEIVNQIGKLFNADRVAVAYYDYNIKNYIITEDAEYKSSDAVRTFVGENFKNIPGFAKRIRDAHIRGQNIIFNNLENYLDENNLRNTDVEDFYKDFGFISSAAINIYYRNVFLGDLVITFNRQRGISDDEIKFIKTLADQAGVAIYQARLYEQEKKRAEREALLRKISETIRSTLDIEVIKNYFIEEICNYFDADRCLFGEFNAEINKMLPFRIEKLRTNEIKSLIGIDGEIEFPEFVTKVKKGKNIIIRDIEKTSSKKKLNKCRALNYLKNSGVKSDYGLTVNYRNQIMGILIIHFVSDKRKLTHDEFEFLDILRYQVGRAIYQANLYNIATKTAKNEKALKEIVLSSVSTFDIKEIIKSIVTEAGKLFNADRCFFVNIDFENNTILPISYYAEYISSKDILSCLDRQPRNEEVEIFFDAVKQKKIGIVEDIRETELPEITRQMLIDDLSVKAYLILPVFYGDTVYGAIVMHYVKDYMRFTDDQIDIAKAIANQSAAIIHQTELHKQTLAQAERETLLRKIFQTMSSSLDIHNIKSTIVTEVGKALNADRCFIIEYNKAQDKFLIVDDEYLSSNNITSYKGTDINEDVPNFADNLKNGMNVIVDNREIFMDRDNVNLDLENRAIERTNVNSAFGIPLYYSGELLGALALHYVENIHKVTEDEINMLQTIANQIAIAIHQSKLYNTLKQNTANQTAILNNMPFMAWLKDQKSRLLAVNNVYAKVCNTTIENIIGKTDFDFFPKEHAEDYIKEDMTVMETKQTISSVDLIIGPDGERWHETFKSPVFDDRGNVVGTAGISRDITEKKVADLELLNRQEQIVKAARREKLIGTIITKAISTFDINEIKQLVSEIGILTKADRCYFVEVDVENMKGKPIDYEGEYLSSPGIKSIIGYEFPTDDVKKFVEIYSDSKDLIVFDYESILKNPDEQYIGIKKYINRFDLKSGIGIPLFYMDKLTAVLAIEYAKEKVLPSEDQLDFLKILGNQTGMAFNQIRLYQNTKRTAEREALLRKIIETIRSSLDINKILALICEEVAKLFNIGRIVIVEYKNPDDYSEYEIRKEFKSDLNIKSITDIKVASLVAAYWGENIFSTNGLLVFDNISESDTPEYFREAYAEIGAKSAMAMAIKKGKNNWGTIILLDYEKYRHWSEEEQNLITAIVDQIYISIYQADLFTTTKQQFEREELLRKIIEAIRSSLDINTIKNQMVNEVGKALGSDICFIMLYESSIDYFYVDEYSEYRAPGEEKSFVGFDAQNRRFKWFTDAFKNHQEVNYSNIQDFITKNNLKDTPEEKFLTEYNIKSGYNIAIYYANNLLGYIILKYTKETKIINEDDLEFLRLIANQAGIAIHQAKLYKITQKQAEREKFSRNIIEILRNTLDKNIIKQLFVKNIGKYYNADRVFFSEYDIKNSRYLSVDKYSEYLSSPNEKSVIGQEWSEDYFKEYIRPLLEKREVKIYSLEEYASEPGRNPGIISILENSNIKSSYSFPVLYQEKIMGYFCIEFTQKVLKFSNEEISMIRNICTQAGIALYHSELYVKAQESAQAKTEFITNVSYELKTSLGSIIEYSGTLSKSELAHDKQIEYLNDIQKSAQHLIEMTNNIIDISKMK